MADKDSDRLPVLGEALVGLLSHGRADASDPASRASVGAAAGILGIACNVALSALKGIVGLLAGSVSIVADALNNLTDAASSVVSYIGFKLASRPADENHPFGHGRYEYIAASLVAVIVMVVGVELVISSIRKIANPEPCDFGLATVVALLCSIVVKLWMMRLNGGLGRRIDSHALLATAVDSRNDVVATSAVLLAAIVSYATGVDLDGWAGLAVGAFIVASGAGLVREQASLLVGAAPDDEEVERIRLKILGYPGVLGTHDLMLHDYGPGRRFGSAHVEVSSEMDAIAGHDLLDRIEQDFLAQEMIEMTLHMDPIVIDGGRKGDLRPMIAAAVRKVDPRLTVHDVRVLVSEGLTSVSFDCVRPRDFEMDDDELCARIFGAISVVRPDILCSITVDDGYLTSSRLDAATIVNGAA